MRLLGHLINIIIFIFKREPNDLTENDLFIKKILENINQITIDSYRSFIYNEDLYYIEDDCSLIYTYINHIKLSYESYLILELKEKIKEIRCQI